MSFHPAGTALTPSHESRDIDVVLKLASLETRVPSPKAAETIPVLFRRSMPSLSVKVTSPSTPAIPLTPPRRANTMPTKSKQVHPTPLTASPPADKRQSVDIDALIDMATVHHSPRPPPSTDFTTAPMETKLKPATKRPAIWTFSSFRRHRWMQPPSFPVSPLES